MAVIQVGLVDKTGNLDRELVEATAAALNLQVMRDLGPVWDIQATVRRLPDPKSIPVGVWPVFAACVTSTGRGRRSPRQEKSALRACDRHARQR